MVTSRYPFNGIKTAVYLWEAIRLDWTIISCHVFLPVFTVFIHLSTFSSPRSNDIFQCMTCLSKFYFIFFTVHLKWSLPPLWPRSWRISQLAGDLWTPWFNIQRYIKPPPPAALQWCWRCQEKCEESSSWPVAWLWTRNEVKDKYIYIKHPPMCLLKLQSATLIRNMFLVYIC